IMDNQVLNHDIKLVEKELAETLLQKLTHEELNGIEKNQPKKDEAEHGEQAAGNKQSKKIDDIPLELEIKVAAEKTNEVDQAQATKSKTIVNTPYDPILDLRDYKYPRLELLEAHGSEK